MTHSDNVKALFEDRYLDDAEGPEGPRDGFIGPQAHRIQLGVATALRASDALKFTLRGGYEYMPTAPGVTSALPVQPLPFYALAGGEFRW
jgi:hypothetical protein